MWTSYRHPDTVGIRRFEDRFERRCRLQDTGM
jgi:hypothetical protein